MRFGLGDGGLNTGTMIMGIKPNGRSVLFT
jgi:hypothetical protein